MDGHSFFNLRRPSGDSSISNVDNEGLAPRQLAARPLSDIREMTEPSLFEYGNRKMDMENVKPNRLSQVSPIKRKPAPNSSRPPLAPIHQVPASNRQAAKPATWSPFPSPRVDDDMSSVYSIPLGNIPPRSSSKVRPPRRSTSVARTPAVLLQPPKLQYRTITNNGRSQSPVREAIARLDPDFENRGRMPSRTILKVESPTSLDIVAHPTHQHPRVKMNLVVVAPLFVGGSSVEGMVHVVVDDAERMRHRKTLLLEKLSVDLLGIEEVGGRQNIFLEYANILVDLSHPPPASMGEPHRLQAFQESSWILLPSSTALPFLIRLPLEVGPPPFYSKQARIRYLLSATMTLKDGGRTLCVRSSQETALISVYDPEKALKSLSSPLTVSETCHLSKIYGQESITVTAGLHRQVWISGTSIFADVHIINKSHKTIKKLELQLERRILCYKHAPAATLEVSAGQARIFDQDERFIASRNLIKPGSFGWNGVVPHSTAPRTCELELPRNHATIKCNKYFEVRYFLNIIVGTTSVKPVMVQLPIILIHMNSLDVPTNSVAQVAAAIEEKRTRRTTARGSPRIARKSSKLIQGRAFNAPRMQSVERIHRQQEEEVAELSRLLEASPRKNAQKDKQQDMRRGPSPFGFKTPPPNRGGRIIGDDTASELRRKLGHLRNVSQTSTVNTNKSLPRRPGENNSRAASAQTHRRAVSRVSNATTHRSLPRRPSENRPRASSALGTYSVSAADMADTEAENVPYSRNYATSVRKQPSLASSIGGRKPKWARKPGWLRTDGGK